MAAVLAHHQLTAVGGFTPVVMHLPGHDPLPAIDRILERYDAVDAAVLVLSAMSGLDGYDSRPDLDDDGWETLLGNLRPDQRPAPPSTACAPCCTPTSAPWSRTATRCSGCSTARPSRCAWTPGTC